MTGAAQKADRWVMLDGRLQRRGLPDRNDANYLLNDTLTGLPDGALSSANMRIAWADPSMGIDTTKLARCSIETTAKGKAFVWTGVAGDQSPITFYPNLTDQTAVEIKMSCWVKFGTDTTPFAPGLGGKVPFGVGSHRNPATNPPSGSTTPDPQGCSSRPMWLYDTVGGVITSRTEFIGYDYLPAVTQLNRHGSLNGGAIDIGSASALDNGWHFLEMQRRMNTVGTEGSSTQPADGTWKMWWDNLLRINLSDVIWRRYSDNFWTKLMIDCFWGGDTTWPPSSGGPYKLYIADPRVVKIA